MAALTPLILQTMLHIVSIMNAGIGTCMRGPLAVLVIMSTQIMRGDWCSMYMCIYIYICIYLPYLPSGKEEETGRRESRRRDEESGRIQTMSRPTFMSRSEFNS